MPEEVAEAPETETNMANTLCYERVTFFCTVDSRSRNVTHKAFLKRFLSKREGRKEKRIKITFLKHTHIDTDSVSAISVTKLRRVK